MKTIFIYITNPNEKTAKKIAKHLFLKKLIVCANIFPIKSIYIWENKLVNDEEFVLLVKTFNDKYKEIEKEIRKIHPYKIPLIAKINSYLNDDYLSWMVNELK